MRSLRGRLTLGITLLLGAVLLLGGISVAHYVDHSERQALDRQLQRTAELSRATAFAAVENSLPDADTRLDAVLRATGSSLLLRVGGQVAYTTGEPPPRTTRQLPLGLHTIHVAAGNYRTYAERLKGEALGGLARIEVASRLAPTERRERVLRNRLLALGAGMLLLVAIGVWLAADVVLRPLRRLRQATASIAGDADLDRRVPADDGPAELRSLAASFDAMLARLRRSAEDRTRALDATRRFAADAGHELRTPLTSVQATLSTLARHPELDGPRRTEMAEEALAEQRRLVALLDGLQALARGDAAPGEATDVELADLIDTALSALTAQYPATNFTTALPEQPVVVCGWEPGLRLLVDNLIANAARHGRAGGRVHVALSAAGEAGAGPVLEVEDDGPGIPIAERARVFEPFARLAGVEHPGSGLGLALVAQQARQHGAEVEIGDASIGGARFTVRFQSV
jgi:signal transduction histidine kinase